MTRERQREASRQTDRMMMRDDTQTNRKTPEC